MFLNMRYQIHKMAQAFCEFCEYKGPWPSLAPAPDYLKTQP